MFEEMRELEKNVDRMIGRLKEYREVLAKKRIRELLGFYKKEKDILSKKNK